MVNTELSNKISSLQENQQKVFYARLLDVLEDRYTSLIYGGITSKEFPNPPAEKVEIIKEILYSDPDNTPYSSNMDINIICNTLGLSSNKTDDRFYNTIHLKGNINLGLFVLDFMDGYKLFAYFVTSYKDINDSIVGEITLKESFK
jgi:hypothetical protein